MAKAKFEGVTYENKERLSDVSFSVRNVQHPKKYGLWNFNVGITPSIHYDKIRYGTLALRTNNSGVIEKYPDLMFQRLSLLANLAASWHTPMGAFVLKTGFGGAFYNLNDGQGFDTFKTREIRKVDLAWVAFMSKRFFVLMGPRYYVEQFEQFTFAFRIGYFWGRF
ncbi:MAG: hypothetical protein KC493_15505 [Bacteriovoracaceae bacterium]|nr:hypothetical protein [Bacteriovoracaceae bacterium]